MFLSWKTIEKLEAKVPGARGKYGTETCVFDVRLGRGSTPLSLTGDDHERIRIENTEIDIAVEAPTLKEAKKLLREKIAASEDYSGTWKLWVHLDVRGGYESGLRYGGEEAANCSIDMKFVVELTTKKRKRHTHMFSVLPTPFVGEFPKPHGHKELSRLQDGPAVPKRESYNRDEVWVEATPELVETIRMLQRRLGESGEKVREALSKKRFMETLEAVRNGSRLLSTSLVSEPTE